MSNCFAFDVDELRALSCAACGHAFSDHAIVTDVNLSSTPPIITLSWENCTRPGCPCEISVFAVANPRSCYQIIGVDPALPGSDQTATSEALDADD